MWRRYARAEDVSDTSHNGKTDADLDAPQDELQLRYHALL